MHIPLKILGYGLALLSAVFFLVFAAMVFDEEEEDRDTALVLAVFCAGATAAGAYIVRKSHRMRDERREKQILELAADRGGRLTAEETAMVTRLNIDECRQLLDTLCLQGAAQMHVTAEGVMEYTFSGLPTAPPEGS